MKTALRTVKLMDDKPRDFTAADKALIKRVHGYMPALQILEVLNERLACDLGPDETPYTMEQLYAEIGEVSEDSTGTDWSSLRKLLAKARREKVLDLVTRQMIDDFAVVFSMTSAQVLRLQDVLLRSRETEE